MKNNEMQRECLYGYEYIMSEILFWQLHIGWKYSHKGSIVPY